MQVLFTFVVLAATARGKTVTIYNRQSNIVANVQKEFATTIKPSLRESQHQLSNSINSLEDDINTPVNQRIELGNQNPDLQSPSIPMMSVSGSSDWSLVNGSWRHVRPKPPHSYHPDVSNFDDERMDHDNGKHHGETRLSKIIASVLDAKGSRRGTPRQNGSQVLSEFKKPDDDYSQKESTETQMKELEELDDVMQQPKFFVLRRTQQYLAQNPEESHQSSRSLDIDPLGVLSSHRNNSRTDSSYPKTTRMTKRSGLITGLMSPKFFLRPRDPAKPVEKRNRRKPVFENANGPHKRKRYDVPQIECPPTQEGLERFACPSPDRMGRYKCMLDHAMCDGFIDCPNAEDEDRTSCMFYHTTKAHLDVLADALLRWARGRY